MWLCLMQLFQSWDVTVTFISWCFINMCVYVSYCDSFHILLTRRNESVCVCLHPSTYLLIYFPSFTNQILSKNFLKYSVRVLILLHLGLLTLNTEPDPTCQWVHFFTQWNHKILNLNLVSMAVLLTNTGGSQFNRSHCFPFWLKPVNKQSTISN
jgi:hypothetical protein